MEEASRLRERIMRLEAELEQSKQQLRLIQQNCTHVYIETPLTRTCAKCLQTESLYY
ncbi:hypothetical protein [Brevibacillus sp. 179-C9.3 HS]|uniref:hypothetical protein n=1 Tax=unclassified Brevibacillus TaxID=2684853 RepID=UPI0039A31136